MLLVAAFAESPATVTKLGYVGRLYRSRFNPPWYARMVIKEDEWKNMNCVVEAGYQIRKEWIYASFPASEVFINAVA